MFDIDNRAGQETGYVFEPIIAAAIGGVSVSAKKSPVHRQSDKRKGRQVDCVRNDDAYEIKIRVTIAASGQGRWREELEFPIDCRASGFSPVLVVLDPTPNPKLDELKAAFLRQGGEFYIGAEAWAHFDSLAGPTMARFIETYVHEPMQSLLAEVPPDSTELPSMTLKMTGGQFTATMCDDTLTVRRGTPATSELEEPELPDDVDDEAPGP